MEIKEKNDELLAEAVAANQSASSEKRPADALSQIQRRAYQLWLERGGGEGRELDDWLQAEAEVNAALGAPDQHTPSQIDQPHYSQQATAG